MFIDQIIGILNLIVFCFYFLICNYAQAEMSDPLEDLNRKMFWFNEKLDFHLLEPTAQIYHDNLPNNVRKSVGNFFDNIKFPIYFVSDVVQLKFSQAGDHTVRFLVNSTVGALGFFDPASSWGFEKHKEDFGAALGYYGIGNGIYLVVPFLGPSSARDVVGLAVDISLNPIWHIPDLNISPRIANTSVVGLGLADLISTRESNLNSSELERSNTLDYYKYVRDRYEQERNNIIYDRQ